ncbi:transposase family protein [Streptomyces sp. 2MCAF27]
MSTLRPRALPHWTSLTIKAYIVLVARVAALLPKPGRRRPWTLLLDNRGLPAAVAWRTNLTHQQLADLFGVRLATVHRTTDRMTPLIAGLLEPPEGQRSDLWVADGALVPVRDCTTAACSKKHQRRRGWRCLAR